MTTHPPTESSEDSTRQRIIDAALHLFGTQGYPRTTTRAIAEAAGVNEVTLFRHFGSKKNLLMACTEAFNATGFAANFERDLTGDYAQDIDMMAVRMQRDAAQAFNLLRLLLCDAAALPELIQAAQSGMQGNAELIAAYFQRQIEAGVIRDDLDPEALTFTLETLFSTSLIVPKMLAPSDAQTSDLISGETLGQMIAVFVQGTIKSNEN